MKYFEAYIQSGNETGFVIRSEENLPKVGDTIDSVQTSLWHTDPSFRIIENFKVDKVIYVRPYRG